jgi:DNA ligase-1
MLENCNELTTDAYGMSKRSSHQANMYGKGMLGAFKMEDINTGEKLAIGGGPCIDNNFRIEVWNNKAEFMATIWTYKYKPFGMKRLPRHPQLVGRRYPHDLG